jgi:hypothetical protein
MTDTNDPVPSDELVAILKPLAHHIGGTLSREAFIDYLVREVLISHTRTVNAAWVFSALVSGQMAQAAGMPPDAPMTVEVEVANGSCGEPDCPIDHAKACLTVASCIPAANRHDYEGLHAMLDDHSPEEQCWVCLVLMDIATANARQVLGLTGPGMN